MKLSLRNRFLVPMVAILILGMGTSALVSYQKSKSSLVAAISAQISQLTDSTVTVMASWMKDRRLDIKSWSKQKVFRTALMDSFVGKAARKSADALLADLKKEYGYYENIVLADLKGELVAAAVPSVVGKINVTDRKYFQQAAAGNLYTSEVMKSKQTGNPVFCVAYPVKEKDTVVGVLFGPIDLSSFSKTFVDSIKIGETGYAFIYDEKGRVLAHPDPKNILKVNMHDMDFGKKMIAQSSGMLHYRWQGVEKIAAFKKDKVTGWTVAVGAATDDILSPVTALRNMNLGIGLSVVLLAVGVILFVVRSIVKPINIIVAGMNEGAEQVASASGQVSSASQSLAEGASEQAASIEETSASLEEMASMTKQNAEHSNHANSLMKKVNGVVDEADQSMCQLTASMKEIADASEETSKIIKTIDEIAFQTNLLALNAAVEAARAGEAGAGFAVVADEVRNLAMRAADAAKNTAALIEGTVKKIGTGTGLVDKTNASFGKVSENAAKVGDLVGEIAAASTEQAQGIDQVNKAVAEMDRVVQQNAASAEESASASEEMTAQSEGMRQFVRNLVALVTGGKDSDTQDSDRRSVPSAIAAAAGGRLKPAKRAAGAQGSVEPETVTPEQLIPLADSDLKDF